MTRTTLATVKAPTLSSTWYSRTQTELDTQPYPVYGLLTPHSTGRFRLRTPAPGEVDHSTPGVAEATPVE